MAQPLVFFVDAFAEEHFKGNQAAVVLSEDEMSDEMKQKLGAEFNLSETTFPEPINGNFQTADRFRIRWFTPTSEVPLCGHATLAAAHVLLNEIGNPSSELRFSSQAGELVARRVPGNKLQLDFPRHSIKNIRGYEEHFEQDTTTPASVIDGILKSTIADDTVVSGIVLSSHKLLLIVVDPKYSENSLQQFKPDTLAMLQKDPMGEYVEGVILTVDARAEGKYDYYSRYFGPYVGIPEDPATGSSQCSLGPFWATVMGKSSLRALQTFPNRGADFDVTVTEGRTLISGQGHTVVRGTIVL